MRLAVRVLLVDPEDRVLLLRIADPAEGVVVWFPPGGGLEGGEDARAAAVREVYEETGLAGVELGPEVWQRREAFRWRGEPFDQHERWFLARVDAFEPSPAAFTAEEAAEITEMRWWTLAEMEATSDLLVPRDLPARLAPLLRSAG